jgi:uncharacterized protein YbcV (DUF1398 family)
MLDEAMADSAMEIRRIKNRRVMDRVINMVAEDETLDDLSVVNQGTPLVNATTDIAPFDRDALIKAIKIDQAGQSSFPKFLKSSWEAGVVSYIVDFEKRVVTYYGVLGESYSENYPAVELE